MNDLMLRALRGEVVERPPVWMMRQAGRTLPEYRAVRAEVGGFKDLLMNPDRAAEVTLQPIDAYGVDAAILFSDILVVPEAMGLPYNLVEKVGPRFPETIRSRSDLDRLHEVLAARGPELGARGHLLQPPQPYELTQLQPKQLQILQEEWQWRAVDPGGRRGRGRGRGIRLGGGVRGRFGRGSGRGGSCRGGGGRAGGHQAQQNHLPPRAEEVRGVRLLEALFFAGARRHLARLQCHLSSQLQTAACALSYPF